MDNKVKSRTNREAVTREETEVRNKQWEPRSTLPEIKQEAGWAYRWVRVSLVNEADNLNVSSRMREGWEPVKHSDHPEVNLPADPNSRFKDGIEVGGLLLCKMPQEMVDQRNEYFKEKAKAQEQAVDNNLMRQNDPRMPLFSDKKSTVTKGKR
jgi:hypothetical protein|tara:strand:+ start:416 stop:874 length:459 start_codon:yes stop_codon:yes gene_type:complete